jgi:hypothetical protein
MYRFFGLLRSFVLRSLFCALCLTPFVLRSGPTLLVAGVYKGLNLTVGAVSWFESVQAVREERSVGSGREGEGSSVESGGLVSIAVVGLESRRSV